MCFKYSYFKYMYKYVFIFIHIFNVKKYNVQIKNKDKKICFYFPILACLQNLTVILPAGQSAGRRPGGVGELSRISLQIYPTCCPSSHPYELTWTDPRSFASHSATYACTHSSEVAAVTHSGDLQHISDGGLPGSKCVYTV